MLRRRGVPFSCRRLLLNHATNPPSKSSLLPLICSRTISTQKRPNSTLSTTETFTSDMDKTQSSRPPPPPAPLAALPTPYLLRTIFICTISTTPFLSNMITKILLTHTAFLTRNPITRFLLQHTFYNHFCAGATQREIQDTLSRLKSWGLHGLILAYAKEVEVTEKGVDKIEEAEVNRCIEEWMQGTLKTIEYSESGAYVAVKYSGAGASCVLDMEHNLPARPKLQSALDTICTLARSRNIKLLFDAEQTRYQDTMDAYTLNLMRTYNIKDSTPIIYNTYQMYRRCSHDVLKRHLETARNEGFSFGAKLVRGAYLHSDPRETFWSTKEESDRAYDEGVEFLLTNNHQSEAAAPVKIGIVVATHNQDSVNHAMSILKSGNPNVNDKEIAFGQLAGMADEVSMSVISGEPVSVDGRPVNVFKYIPWGSMEECMKYLLRRADENKDSLKRTDETRRAAWRELWRRATGRV